MKKAFICSILLLFAVFAKAQIADQQTYLANIKTDLNKQWPANRIINLVFHGHSVPAGYQKSPEIRTLESYPYQLLRELKKIYPLAEINVIITAIGGENSVNGAKRFDKDVLIHQPDVLFIDYALNDYSLPLAESKKAMEEMIEKALAKNIKVILLTPSPDQRLNILQDGNALEKVADQLKSLAAKYHIGCADPYSVFKQMALSGGNIVDYMSQVNHPNEKGNYIIASEILKYFK